MTTSHPREERGQAGEGLAVSAWLAEQENAARGKAADCRPNSAQEHWHRAQAAAYEAAHAYAVVRPDRATASQVAPVTGTEGELGRSLKAAFRQGVFWGQRNTAYGVGSAPEVAAADLFVKTYPDLPTAPQPAGAERVRAVLAEWFSDAEGMCRAYEGDLPDKAEIYVVAAKRSRLYLGTYGELRRAALGSGEGTAGAPSGPDHSASPSPSVSALSGECSSRVEFREDPSAPGRPSHMLPILDEAIVHGAGTVHAEMMGDHDLWIGISAADGREVRLNVFIENGFLRFCGEDEGVASVRDRSGEAGETEGLDPWGQSPAPLGATPHPQSPSLSEVEEAKAVLNKYNAPESFAKFYRSMARLENDPAVKAGWHKSADAIEAALATLTASQEQDGEVRR